MVHCYMYIVCTSDSTASASSPLALHLIIVQLVAHLP